jgi:inorganic pyrophosphatase
MKKTSNPYKLHPWHGIDPEIDGEAAWRCYVEVVPGDAVKYEIDKTSGYLYIDRPNTYSNTMPVLYGFIPQTYCAEKVADFCRQKTHQLGIVGDKDPLDICILTDRHIPRGDILVQAIPVGGFRMIDRGEADDKIIAVLKDDHSYGHLRSLKDCPLALIKRIKHYFMTYKNDPDNSDIKVQITDEYEREEALQIIKASRLDYQQHFDINLTKS